MANTKETKKAAQPSTDMTEIGVAGLRVSSGYLFEEYLPQLRGAQGRRVFLEMSQNDATVGAMLRAIGLLIRAVKWDVVPAVDTPEAQVEADFVKSLMEDMSHTWQDFLQEVLSSLIYGWSFHEVVLKRRVGPTEAAPERRSKYSDGRIGIRKMPIRAQDTLLQWVMQPDGGIEAMIQLPPTGGAQIKIPIERALLFRTVSRKNSPEGESLLRTAYRSWFRLKNIEDFEAIGIERELAGLPVIRIPKEFLQQGPGVTPQQVATRMAYEKVARDLRFNEQGGIVIPSDTFQNPDGSMSSVPMVDIKLLNTGGARSIDTISVVMRYHRNIARSVLADFLLLGETSSAMRGGQGMHQGKVDFFMQGCEAILDQIEAPLNNYLLPRLWAINGLDITVMPKFKHGDMQPVDPALFAAMIKDLAGSGMALFPDDNVEEFVRETVGLPLKSAETTIS